MVRPVQCISVRLSIHSRDVHMYICKYLHTVESVASDHFLGHLLEILAGAKFR